MNNIIWVYTHLLQLHSIPTLFLIIQAIVTSEQATREFLSNQQTNPVALKYYVNQADPHSFTPLMTAVCLSNNVDALNISMLLVEAVCDKSLHS